MEYRATLYVNAENQTILDRIKYYLSSDSRPDFPDEVPEQELELFKHFEFAETPEEVYTLSSNELAAYFEPDSMEDMTEIAIAVAMLNPNDIYLHIADDEDTQQYYRHTNRGMQLIYSEFPTDHQEEVQNKKLPEEVASTLINTVDKGKALAELAKYLQQNQV